MSSATYVRRHSDRLVIYTGFDVSIQDQLSSSDFDFLGTLPPGIAGGIDPAFIVTAPDASFFVLGTGANAFPKPFNGSIFTTSGKPKTS
ncbi:hypothetical protein [Nostoc commune]|uniref:hypothetical protein n=1 Tax=Nostoc commune TaxID=1178 RepID=UPI0018C5E1DD|nr:hypothetical protein [Nostoc commune]MBG1262164.1 hypothetical protein [Nostoc commune BAE]